MKEYEEFKMVALRAKKGDIVPAYDEIIFTDKGKDCVIEFSSWRTDIVQAVAKAALIGELEENEEMIIVVKKHVKE